MFLEHIQIGLTKNGKKILVDAVHPEETRVAVADDSKLIEFDFETQERKQIKSNIYLGKITRVEPSLQAAFVEYGGNRQGFLPFSEIHYDYYQIPTEDKEKLAAALRAEKERLEKLEEKEFAEEIKAAADAQSAEQSGATTIDAAQVNISGLDNDNAGQTAANVAHTEVHYIAQTTEVMQEVIHNAENAVESSAGNLSADLVHAAATNAVIDGEVKLPESPLSDIDIEAIRKAAELEKQFALEIMGEEYVVEKYGDITADAQDDVTAAVEDGANRSDFYKQYRIQEVIKRNQVVLVQVVKEERGNKGASITTYIAMPGRFCVFMPNTENGGGVSRRIASYSDRKRMRETLKQLDIPQGTSAILRTAGVDKEVEEIKRDLDYLVSLWNNIRKQTMESTAPALIYEESDLVKRSLRDLFRNDVSEIIIEGEQAYNSTAQFMGAVAPNQASIIKKHSGKQPIFEQYKIEEQLDELYEPVCKLESGGYVVITPTEALVSIDVNSGRATRERSIEDTAVRTNIEAAREIARQLRLRDLAGLVVIDFIDMRDVRNRKAVERELKDALKSDRSKIQVGRISPFGLLEMSRQRLRSSIVESSSVACPMCKGLGVVRSSDSQSLKILRAIEAEASKNNIREIRVIVSHEIAFTMLNKMRSEIKALEDKDSVRITIIGDHDYLPNQYKIDSAKGRNKREGFEQNYSNTNDAQDHSGGQPNNSERRGKKPYGKQNNHHANNGSNENAGFAQDASKHANSGADLATNSNNANSEIPDYLLAEEAQMPDYNSYDNQSKAPNGMQRRRNGERGGDRNRRGGRNNRNRNRRDSQKGEFSGEGFTQNKPEYNKNYEQKPSFEPINDNSFNRPDAQNTSNNTAQNADANKAAPSKLKGLWKKITS